MSEKQAPNGKEFDPTDAFREMRNSYLDAWSKTMVDAVNSDAYAKASGMMLNTYLSSSSPFREAVEKVMLQALQQFSMPSRADVVSIAERAVNIEMRLDDLDAKLDRIEKRLTKPTSARRPPARAPDRGSKKKGKR
ncbi:MAG: hypothetical protein ABSF59_17450 [Candidatus Sulfotelmatobacter sp.]|jgi:hypothetical protein